MLNNENTEGSCSSSVATFDENTPEFIADLRERVEAARDPGKRISIDELFAIVADKRKMLYGN